MQQDELELYKDPDGKILFIIELDNPKANFHLLSEYDLMHLSKRTREECILTQESPFKFMRLIVYRDTNGSVNFKLLYGMASRLVKEMDLFCSSIFKEFDM